jgi:hypothetical protein
MTESTNSNPNPRPTVVKVHDRDGDYCQHCDKYDKDGRCEGHSIYTPEMAANERGHLTSFLCVYLDDKWLANHIALRHVNMKSKKNRWASCNLYLPPEGIVARLTFTVEPSAALYVSRDTLQYIVRQLDPIMVARYNCDEWFHDKLDTTIVELMTRWYALKYGVEGDHYIFAHKYQDETNDIVGYLTEEVPQKVTTPHHAMPENHEYHCDKCGHVYVTPRLKRKKCMCCKVGHYQK